MNIVYLIVIYSHRDTADERGGGRGGGGGGGGGGVV